MKNKKLEKANKIMENQENIIPLKSKVKHEEDQESIRLSLIEIIRDLKSRLEESERRNDYLKDLIESMII